jgi:glycine/sarcosine N-methyltransferase
MDNQTNAFYDAIADFYPLFYKDWDIQLEREGLTLRSIFRNKGVETILDVACGPGTQTIPLAKLGFSVVGVDPSIEMLKKAQRTADEYDASAEWHRADFLSLMDVIDGPFDAIVCKGNSLPHLLTDEEIEITIQTFFELLRPGGVLVIGLRDFEMMLTHRPRFLPGFDHQDDDDTEFITFDIWEWENGPPIIATQNLFIVRGEGKDYQTVKRTVQFRPLSTDELQVVLLEHNFEEIDQTSDRWEQIITARKPLSG